MNFYLPMVQRLANASARPVGSKNRLASQLDEEPAVHRYWQTNILPLLMSLMCVGLVTAALLLLDQHLALSLDPYRRHPMGNLAGHSGVDCEYGRDRLLLYYSSLQLLDGRPA